MDLVYNIQRDGGPVKDRSAICYREGTIRLLTWRYDNPLLLPSRQLRLKSLDDEHVVDVRVQPRATICRRVQKVQTPRHQSLQLLRSFVSFYRFARELHRKLTAYPANAPSPTFAIGDLHHDVTFRTMLLQQTGASQQ